MQQCAIGAGSKLVGRVGITTILLYFPKLNHRMDNRMKTIPGSILLSRETLDLGISLLEDERFEDFEERGHGWLLQYSGYRYRHNIYNNRYLDDNSILSFACLLVTVQVVCKHD
jgi:hypothetical protein